MTLSITKYKQSYTRLRHTYRLSVIVSTYTYSLASHAFIKHSDRNKNPFWFLLLTSIITTGIEILTKLGEKRLLLNICTVIFIYRIFEITQEKMQLERSGDRDGVTVWWLWNHQQNFVHFKNWLLWFQSQTIKGCFIELPVYTQLTNVQKFRLQVIVWLSSTIFLLPVLFKQFCFGGMTELVTQKQYTIQSIVDLNGRMAEITFMNLKLPTHEVINIFIS
jgi:hypothetical protein